MPDPDELFPEQVQKRANHGAKAHRARLVGIVVQNHVIGREGLVSLKAKGLI